MKPGRFAFRPDLPLGGGMMRAFVPWIVGGVLIFSPGRLAAGYSPLEEAQFRSIRPAEVAALVQSRGAEWLSRVVPGQSRLCYDEPGWAAKVAAIRSLDGIGARWRSLLKAAADRIVAEPARIPPPGKAGDPEGWQRGYGDSLVALAAASRIFPDPVYRERLKSMVLAGCAVPTWGNDGENGDHRNMDLAAGHMARGLAIAYDWNRSLFDFREAARVRAVFRERMPALLKGLYGGVFWSHWYSQNHNHISVAGLGIAGAAFLGEIPEAKEWLAAAVLDYDRIAAAMYPDGSSFEGALYWGYGRAFIVQFIEATRQVTGEERLYRQAFLRHTLDFRVGCAAPALGAIPLWGDSRGYDSKGPQDLLYRLASQYRDGRGQYLADHFPNAPLSPDSVAWTVLWYDPSVPEQRPSRLDYWAENWGLVNSRSGWGEGDYLLSFKAGFNRNHHTKPDAGALSLNLGGEWLLLAPGYGLHSEGSGFFDQAAGRWKYWSNDTSSHSALLIDGANQRTDLAGGGVIDHYLSTAAALWSEADLSNAYVGGPAVSRQVLHRRGEYILVLDRVRASHRVTVEWLAQVPPTARLSGKSVRVDGMHGSLEISPLGDSAGFQARNPSAPVVDVSPSRLTTYATLATGRDLTLATLLRPTFRGEPSKPLRSRAQRSGSGVDVTIQAADWDDEIWADAAALPSGDQAEFLSVRHQGGRVQSVLAGSVTNLQTPPLTVAASRPADLALELAGPGRWSLVLATPLAGSVRLSSGFALREAAGKLVDCDTPVELAPGRYWLCPPGTPAPVEPKIEVPCRRANPDLEMRTVAAQPPLDSSVRVIWPAGVGFTQSRGEATAFTVAGEKPFQALMNFGSESPAHRVAWPVEVPTPGRYRLVLRCAAEQPEVALAVTVDGAVQTAAALACRVLGPAGWGRERYFRLAVANWKDEPVSDGTGRQLVLNLTAGRHEIGLAEPSAGLNLDRLALIGTR